ncbi:putative non-canonical poly(A) RNA polymerase PAPD5 [Apostichopus japonicus]|uniref:Putative non-canonical poly(A) RNA polymerase PAPD5 n=1 Tax=Stichopus japonicus TaxID=307972 RepID=A0A2G8KL59_STIJA|nr:putative non-canonical poly(A) RNA polymerase PAPD5 [Apostichopus japonicus]
MCDIDLVFLGDLGDNPCRRLGEELKNCALPSQGTIKVLDKATVPIVKLTDAFTQIRVDISFNVKTTTECAKFIELHVSPEPINYGVLLIGFFELYGVNFNYFKTGITVENGGSYFPKEDASFMTDRFSLLC